jgi:hypothetical protein
MCLSMIGIDEAQTAVPYPGLSIAVSDQHLVILTLTAGSYEETEFSRALPFVTAKDALHL